MFLVSDNFHVLCLLDVLLHAVLNIVVAVHLYYNSDKVFYIYIYIYIYNVCAVLLNTFVDAYRDCNLLLLLMFMLLLISIAVTFLYI